MIEAAFNDWAYKWLWSNNSVGNFTDDAILLGVFGVAIKRGVQAVKRRHAEQRAHEARMEVSQQVLHARLGTGHTVRPPLETKESS